MGTKSNAASNLDLAGWYIDDASPQTLADEARQAEADIARVANMVRELKAAGRPVPQWMKDHGKAI